MSKTGWLLAAILLIGFVLRILYCWNLPLSGDESVSLLQAAGKALDYPSRIPHSPTPVGQLQSLMEYSPDRGVRDVLKSMEQTGMHPPLYYLLLHSLIKYAGNDVLLLRIFSVVFSVLSIGLFFSIGKKLRSPACGLLAAALLAVSPYSIQFALLIRPYPLVMFLSLLSSRLILEVPESSQKQRSLLLYLAFVFTAVIGLYSIYLFIFVFVFDLAFLVLSNPKEKINWLAAAAAGGLVFLLYLPWLPSFFHQLKVVRTGNYYFYGTSSFRQLLEYLFTSNFSEFLPGTYAFYKFLILGIVSGIGLAGVLQLQKNKAGKAFLLAFGIYLAAYYLADRIFQMKTLNSPHFQFFTIPVVLLILALGVVSLPRKYSPPAAAFLFLVLGANLYRSFAAPRTHDGPHCTQNFTKAVHSCSQNSFGLLVFNNSFERLILATVAPLRVPLEAIAAPRAAYLSTLNNLDTLQSYEYLFFPVHDCPDVHWNPDEQTLQQLQDYLEELGFFFCEKVGDPFSQKTYMLIFKRASSSPSRTENAPKTISNG
ncbi:MAG TPA: glycosyltransferase family 39 protein [Anaerohalosphaeraceae bacterium]|nr:glycosyltransferase family 39 protein [Anaerohalosphaeraceae bacterium]